MSQPVLSPLLGLGSFSIPTHGLRRGLHSYAAPRLNAAGIWSAFRNDEELQGQTLKPEFVELVPGENKTPQKFLRTPGAWWAEC